MKKKKQIFMLLLALLVGLPLSAQSKQEKKEQKKEAIKKLIASENYKIDVRTAMPMRGRSIPLTSPYSLEIRNDSVISYLPYFGRGGVSGLFEKLLQLVVLAEHPAVDDFLQFIGVLTEDGVYER